MSIIFQENNMWHCENDKTITIISIQELPCPPSINIFSEADPVSLIGVEPLCMEDIHLHEDIQEEENK